MPRLLDSCISTGKFWQVDTAQKCRGERSRCVTFVYTSPNFWPHWFPSTLKQMSLCTAHHRPIKTLWPSQICWTPTLMLTWPRDHVILRQWQVSAVSPLWLMVFNIYAKVRLEGPSKRPYGREQRNLSNSSFPLKAHQKQHLWWQRPVSNENRFYEWLLGEAGFCHKLWTDKKTKKKNKTISLHRKERGENVGLRAFQRPTHFISLAQ